MQIYLFLYCFLELSWRRLNRLKVMPQRVGTFSTIDKSIMTFVFCIFLTTFGVSPIWAIANIGQVHPGVHLGGKCVQCIVNSDRGQRCPFRVVYETSACVTIARYMRQLREGAAIAPTHRTHHRSLGEAVRTPTV